MLMDKNKFVLAVRETGLDFLEVITCSLHYHECICFEPGRLLSLAETFLKEVNGSLSSSRAPVIQLMGKPCEQALLTNPSWKSLDRWQGNVLIFLYVNSSYRVHIQD